MKITSAKSNRGWNKICSKWNIFCSKLSIFEFIYICISIIYDIGFSTGCTTSTPENPMFLGVFNIYLSHDYHLKLAKRHH